MGKMSIVKELLYKKKGSAPGKSIVLKTRSAGDQERETEHYQLHGISSGTTPDSRAVEVSTGTAGRVIIATHNYNLEVEVEAGQTKIYSTSADGKTLKSVIDLDVDGNILLNGDSKTFVTHSELNTALQTFVTALNTNLAAKLDGGGTAGVLTIDISSAATTTVKTGG